MEPTNQIPECEETKCEETRKLLVATYYPPKMTFVVPKGIDLENKEQVKEYWVKYGVLYIALTNGKTLKVSSFQKVEDPVFKYPEETEIIDAEDEELDLDDYEDDYEESENEESENEESETED